MNFMEAVKAMKEGKKVKRPNFSKGAYHYIEDGHIWLHSVEEEPSKIIPAVFFFEATDWEIVEEKKTLSDRIITADGLHHEVKVCIEEDVKQFIKDIKDDVKVAVTIASERPDWKERVNEIINKRAGERLI